MDPVDLPMPQSLKNAISYYAAGCTMGKYILICYKRELVRLTRLVNME
tara:strand:+ start:241 stop:384 length:144 start_codon:yes stop_codon:yes gene_type:complete